MRVRRLNATAVTLTGRNRRVSRRLRGYELVVHELGWSETIHLGPGETEAMLWRQLRVPVRVAESGETTLWRYCDTWYLAPDDATAAAIVEAAETPQPEDQPRLVRVLSESGLGPTELWLDPPQLDAAPVQLEESFVFPYVGRLVCRDFLSELAEYARRERLEMSCEADKHVFSVGLTVTVSGDSRAVARFARWVDVVLFRYHGVRGE